MYRRSTDKWLALIQKLEAVHRSGQPVLVGTASVADSEFLASFLTRRKLEHRVLNARQDSEEAAIVAEAGQRGNITIATNMAGRGTDIKLGPGVEELGGLHVIVAECNEEYRVDRQLYGRCARQGDPGSCETLLSLSDALVQNASPLWMRRLLGRYMVSKRPLPAPLGRAIVGFLQGIMARRFRGQRRALMYNDEKLGKMLSYSGPQE
jgi:preprotein translocase subunit SecA